MKCKDVVMGRGSGTQNHCGNVAYRKLVYLNKVRPLRLYVLRVIINRPEYFLSPPQELYATSSKFDKLKISKAIVASVRHFGGNFIQADEQRGGLYFDIGDKRAWDKTSQALREGQAEIRDKLAEEDPAAGMSKISEYKQVISEQAFFAYACKIMESLFYSASGESGISACGPECPYAKRRQTLHQLGANPMQVFNAMCSMAPPPLPPPQVMQQHQPHQLYSMQYDQPYNPSMASVEGSYSHHVTPSPSMLFEQQPFNAPVSGGGPHSLDPLPYKPPHGSLDQLPYTPFTASEPSLEPIPHKMEHPSLHLTSSIFSLNKMFSDDFEASSEEGKQLMSLLDEEVDDLIRRKSLGLIQIDTKYAFEDLMLDEDCEMSEAVLDQSPCGYDRKSSSTGTTLNSGSTFASSMLSAKDDVALMNMSFLSLDDRGGVDFSDSVKEGKPRKSILLKHDSSLPKDIKGAGSRVSFFGSKYSSLASSIMSMDSRSFSELVECIKDPDDADQEVEENSSHSSFSRKMGFPIRRSVVVKLEGADPPAEFHQKDSGVTSSLTITGDFAIKSDEEFIDLAGKVQNPLDDSPQTLKSISEYNMSNMTLSVASMGASFIDLLNEDDK